MACLIAVMVAILGVGALAGGGALSWIGVATFFIVAGFIWLCGRCALMCGQKRKPVRR